MGRPRPGQLARGGDEGVEAAEDVFRAGPDDGYGTAADGERRAAGRGVDTGGQSGDHGDTTLGKPTRDGTCVGDALGGGGAGAHDSDTELVVLDGLPLQDGLIATVTERAGDVTCLFDQAQG